jgi:hypothetical protein
MASIIEKKNARKSSLPEKTACFDLPRREILHTFGRGVVVGRLFIEKIA